jgi:hypothetical protein
MSKRRRTSSIASRGQEDDSLDSLEASTSTGPSMRKRSKKLDPMELCCVILLLGCQSAAKNRAIMRLLQIQSTC